MCLSWCGDVQRCERQGCIEGRGVTTFGGAGLLGEAALEESRDGTDSRAEEAGHRVRKPQWRGGGVQDKPDPQSHGSWNPTIRILGSGGLSLTVEDAIGRGRVSSACHCLFAKRPQWPLFSQNQCL